MIQPPPLRQGDTVALVSPSGPVPGERVDAAVAVLTGWGLRPKVFPHVLHQHGFLGGTDAERLGDLQAAINDPESRAIWCTRGGYGMQRIVDRLDVTPLRDDPKLVVGFSDITSLHLSLWRQLGLATVHGPVAAQMDKGADSITARGAHLALMTDSPIVIDADPEESTFAVRAGGQAMGTLIGGNLCLIAASAGTRDLTSLAGMILLIEDIDEPPYKVDRMLTQLMRAGVLDAVAGVAIGQFTGCGDAADVLTERLATLGVPVLGGLPVGHGDQHLAVPLGTTATLDADAGTLVVASATRLP